MTTMTPARAAGTAAVRRGHDGPAGRDVFASEARRERARLARELRRHLLPAFAGLVERATGAGDAAAVQSDVALHAIALRRYVERLAATKAEDGGVTAAIAAERVGLARRLHDTALQLVEYVVSDAYGLGLSCEDIARHLGDAVAELRAAADEPAAEEAAARCVVETAVRDARRLGLERVAVEGDALDASLVGADLELVAGTVREALTNVRKHACATQTVVRVERLSRALRVTVEDDGVGADKRSMARASGLGLRGSIFGRAGEHAAQVDVDTAPGAGTRITLTMPEETV
jgi:signal transduction histidine kinase